MLLIISTSPPSPTSPTRFTSPINSKFRIQSSKFRMIINRFYSHCRGDWQIALTKPNFSDSPFYDSKQLRFALSFGFKYKYGSRYRYIHRVYYTLHRNNDILSALLQPFIGKPFIFSAYYYSGTPFE